MVGKIGAIAVIRRFLKYFLDPGLRGDSRTPTRAGGRTYSGKNMIASPPFHSRLGGQNVRRTMACER